MPYFLSCLISGAGVNTHGPHGGGQSQEGVCQCSHLPYQLRLSQQRQRDVSVCRRPPHQPLAPGDHRPQLQYPWIHTSVRRGFFFFWSFYIILSFGTNTLFREQSGAMKLYLILFIKVMKYRIAHTHIWTLILSCVDMMYNCSASACCMFIGALILTCIYTNAVVAKTNPAVLAQTNVIIPL